MTTTRAKSKKAASNICLEISNKISTREALSVVEAIRQNILKAFPLPSNRNKLSLVATGATFSSLTGFSPVKVPLKRHTWVSSSIVFTLTKSPKVFNNKPVNKLVFFSIDSTLGASSTTSSRKMGQSLVSAIVTPNPFVVLNKILNEIFIASSNTSSKMGQNQPLAVLPNVVSFVSGATSSGAWETITMASTLVPNATFKIKLAHVKTSVLKDNMKLFCVEFAFQVSLEAAFLVEFTSSVHLATLKIPKSLVVSESGSPFVAVVLCDVLLGVFAADIKTALNVFGVVTHVMLKPADIWQYVVVHFENLVASVLVGKDSVQILLFVNQQKAIVSHNRFKAKLVNFLPGCTAFEISDMISQVGDQTCFILQSPNFNCCFHFVLVTFGFQAELNFAVIKTDILRKCQETGHLAVDCKMSLPFSLKTLKVFNSHFVSNVSYAKAFATLSGSGFPPLMTSDLLASSLAASPAASIVDSTIKLRLNSMEKQILDLTALVKSVIEPIGFLVTLVTTLLNDNAAKTLKIEKNLLTMCNASKDFAELLIGVFKNFVSLKAEVEFSNLDENDIGAVKASLLSEDTVDHAVALW
ncbi:hypothetical protein G9A89_011866 [Geosiphon pyriformis]|nr:hypothetical protein G9A89_011866 [Geosiphon pyriformis]